MEPSDSKSQNASKKESGKESSTEGNSGTTELCSAEDKPSVRRKQRTRKRQPNRKSGNFDQAHPTGDKSAVRKKQQNNGSTPSSNDGSFTWQPDDGWKNSDLMAFVNKRPEHYAKLEQEMRPLANVKIEKDHIIVSLNSDVSIDGWWKKCQNELAMFFKDFSSGSEIFSKFDRHLHENGSTEITTQSTGNGLRVTVTGLAKDVERKLFELKNQYEVRSQRKNSANNAKTKDSSQHAANRQQGRPPPLMKFQQGSASHPRFSAHPRQSSPQHHLYHPHPMMGPAFHSPRFQSPQHHVREMQQRQQQQQQQQQQHQNFSPVPQDLAVFPIQIQIHHQRRFTDRLIKDVKSKAHVRVNWQPPTFIEIIGHIDEVEKARKVINEEVFREETKRITCQQQWVFHELNRKGFIDEELGRFPELKIYYEKNNIVIRGHPIEVEPVFNRLREKVNEFVLRKISKEVLCMQWVFEEGEVQQVIDELRKIYLELEIRFEENKILIRGHPSEVEPVHYRLKEGVKEFDEKNIDVPKNFHGCIIGKKGQTIKELETRHSVHIFVPSQNDETSNVRIRGKKRNIKTAKDDIQTLLTKAEQTAKLEKSIEFPNWLHSRLEAFTKNQAGSKEVRLVFFKHGINITGPRNKVEQLHTLLQEKVTELENTLAYEDVKVRIKHLKHIIGIKGELMEKYQVEIIIPQSGSNSDTLLISGVREQVFAAKNEILHIVSELENMTTKITPVPYWLMKFIVGGGKNFILDIEQMFPQVLIEADKKQIEMSGSSENVDEVFFMIQQKIEELLRMYKLVAIPMEANQLLGLIGHRHRNLENLRNELEVNIRYTTSPVKLFIDGKTEEVEKAHVNIVVKIQSLVDYCVLETCIAQDQMGKLIGKSGSNIERLKNMFEGVVEIVTPWKERPNENVLLMGRWASVTDLHDRLSAKFNAVVVGYRNEFPAERRKRQNGGKLRNKKGHYSSSGNLSMKSQTLSEAGSVSSINDFDEYSEFDDVNLLGMSEDNVKLKAVIFTWSDADTNKITFVCRSKIHLRKLKEKIQGSVNISERKIVIAGESSDMDEQQWIHDCQKKLKLFFVEYSCQVVYIDPRSSLDRTDIIEDDVIVEWIDDEVTVCGLKIRVDEICSEYEVIKTKTKEVSFSISINDYVARYVKESVTEMLKFQNSVASIKSVNFDGATIVVNDEILEICCESEWKKKHNQVIEQFLSQYAWEEISVLPHAGEMRAYCKKHEECVISWDLEKQSLIVYGLKSDVGVQTNALKIKLHQIKNEKKHVTLTQCYNGDSEIFEFVKDSQMHIKKLEEQLRVLGSPLLRDKSIVVISEILKTSLTHEWEEKCRSKISDFFFGYKLENVFVSAEKSNRAVTLVSSRPSVITKWSGVVNCLKVCGDKFAVDAMVYHIKEKLTEECDALDNSTSSSNLPGSPTTEEIEVKNYSAFEFLNEQIGLLDALYGIKNQCKISVERIVDDIHGEKEFVCIPPVEDDDKAKTVFGNLTVTVEEGDITEEECLAIVNTTDKSFSFHGPLSRSVISKGGDDIKNQCLAQVDPVMRVSFGGKLKCLYVIHVVIPSQYESMSNLIEKILKQTEELGLSSVALPTIGAGGGGWNSRDVAIGMQTGISNFAKANPNLKFLQNIKIMLFPEMPEDSKRPFYYKLLVNNDQPVKNNDNSIRPGFFSGILNFLRRDVLSKQPVSEPIQREKSDDANDNNNENVGKFAKVSITSNKSENTKVVKAEMEKFVKLHLKEFVLDDTAICRLKKNQIEKMMEFANEKKIRVVIDRTGDVHTIRIQGRSEDVTNVQESVQKIISGIAKDFPETWDTMPESETVLRVPLKPTSREYFMVEEKFVEANRDQFNRYNVTMIERLQNQQLYRYYALKKEELSKKAKTKPFERELFHGTDCETIGKICKLGFDKCYAGKNATMYGTGTYFSKESSYSNAYTKQASITDAKRQMFLANVLTGDYCQGASGLNAPPHNTSTGFPYDSTVDNAANPTMFVVFKDCSTYPSYIISYTR